MNDFRREFAIKQFREFNAELKRLGGIKQKKLIKNDKENVIIRSSDKENQRV